MWLDSLPDLVRQELPVDDLLEWLVAKHPNPNSTDVLAGFSRLVFHREFRAAFAEGTPQVYPIQDGEIEAAQQGRLPDLMTLADVRGDLQSHTTGSDGRAGLEIMANAARDLGYAYLAITDHSRSRPLGLDAATFESCYDGRLHQKRIASNFAEGERRRINSTPTFMIGDKRYTAALSYDELKAAVDSATKK